MTKTRTGRSSSLQAFFHRRLDAAVRRQQVATQDATIWYLTHLLTDYARADRVFDHTEHGVDLRPLVDLYAQAQQAASAAEQRLLLQRLGDLALFIAGLFSDLLTRPRRLVDKQYYMGMGGAAYQSLASADPPQPGHEIFADLGCQFESFTRVLAEVGGDAHRYGHLRLIH